MSKKKSIRNLSRRERQIMDIIYQRGEATAADVRKLIADPPSYSSVRALLRVLEEKSLVRHRQEGPRYVYSPMVARSRAKVSALKHLMRTFFDDSTGDVVAALMDISASKLSDEEFDNLSKLIEESRKEGR